MPGGGSSSSQQLQFSMALLLSLQVIKSLQANMEWRHNRCGAALGMSVSNAFVQGKRGIQQIKLQ